MTTSIGASGAPPFRPAFIIRELFMLLFGVLLPAIALVVELTTHMCGESFFDPIPTLGHVLAVAMVPLANLLTLRALSRRGTAGRLDRLVFAQALAVGIAGVYALTFAPITPLALVAIPFYGLGVLALAPLLSFISCLLGLSALRRLETARAAESVAAPKKRRALAGLAAGVAVLVALAVPTTATRLMMAAAGSDDAAVSRRGVTWLRRIGQRDLMLRACYERATGTTDIVSALVNVAFPVPPAKEREIYYRVTGRPFDNEPRPRLGRSRDSTSEWDVAQGGLQVGVVALRGLALASSRVDGSVDGRAALGYLEWTFELRNDAPIPREARAEVALPPGGVVSRVTLWIDGVEQEASFAGRDVTRRAYQRVVGSQRDPILVTTSAPDRILIQCFPVGPGGGVMKARIGITAPLQPSGPAAGTLGLPYFTQRNFEVPPSVGHAVWIASKDSFAEPTAPLVHARGAGGEEIRGRLAEPASPGPLAAVTVQRPAGAVRAWTADRAADGAPASPDAIVRQILRPEPLPRPSRLVVVVDGSGAMAGAAKAVAAALRALPASVPAVLLVAGDEPQSLAGAPSDRLADVHFDGGIDSVPALDAAWDLAAAAPGGAVLWIHGPQPLLLASPEELRQRVERRRDGPAVYTYAATGGENRLLASLADLPGLEPVARFTTGAADLATFLRALGGAEQRIVAVRTRDTGARAGELDGAETSDHLARLWARDRIDALARGLPGAPASAADRHEALALAARYHLVTPVSGAVVLATRAETAAVAGDPQASPDVPTVPEPETWALLLLVAAVLLGVIGFGRRRARGGPHATA
jgi:hypothetical protein